MEAPEIHSAALNTTFKGVATSENVIQFRNIKFASIPRRFARSQLVEAYEGVVVDATAHGPNPPAREIPPGVRPDKLFFGIPDEQLGPLPVADELECLNLSITLPKDKGAGHPLPVYVNIPGGANTMAPSGVRMFDFTRLVQSSIMLGKPIIVVHVPYRVGLCGYGLLPGGKGGGNNALFDQRNALEWIKRNISSFGGDAENITLGGESAGAFSVDAHLQAKEQVPYFRRAILMSGTLRVLQFHSVEKRIELTRNAAAAIGLDGEDWPERLMEVSTEEIIEAQTKSGVTTMHGIDDGEWLDGDVAQMKKVVVPEWVDSIMIGDCGFEGFLWAAKYMDFSVAETIKLLEEAGEVGRALLKAYPGINPDAPPMTAAISILYLLQDICFSHPIHALTAEYKSAGKPVYSYLFDQDNPWAPTHRAQHACDLLYWFNGYDLPTAKDQAVADAMKEALVMYVNGEVPWNANETHAFGPDGFVGTITEKDVKQRRRVDVYKLLDGFDPTEALNATILLRAH